MKTYIFTKNSNFERPRNVSEENYASSSYGTQFSFTPVDNPFKVYRFASSNAYSSSDYRIIDSLKNTINYYKAQDDMFNYDKFKNTPTLLCSLSSFHLGSGIKKGTVSINSYLSGTKIGNLQDKYFDGVLYDSASNNKAGIVLYREGFILINHTGSLNNTNVKYSSSYDGLFTDKPKWINMFISASDSYYCDINYDIKSDVSTNTTFVFADKNKFNHSNNATYIESGTYTVSTGSLHFYESEQIKVKKTNLSPFNSGSAQFEKQTFISTIGLYDVNRKLIAIANLANPIRKTENREFLFKLKLDI